MTSSELEYLHINTEADTMEKKLLRDRYEFWDRLPLVAAPETEFGEEAQFMSQEVKKASKDELLKELEIIVPEKDEL